MRTAPGSGVSQTLAASHRGRTSSPRRAATYASMSPWLLRLGDAWAAADIMNNGPERSLGSPRSHLLNFTLATKYPETPVGPPHWTWTAWTEAEPPSPIPGNFETPRLCATLGKGTGDLPRCQNNALKIYHHLLHASHPGPKAGGRPNQRVLLRLPDQSTGVRVTSVCPSLVGPKVPVSGSDGKPRQEQNDLTLAETATDGSLPIWPILASIHFHDHVESDLQDRLWPQVWLLPETRGPLKMTSSTLPDRSLPLYHDKPRRVWYYVCRIRSVPLRIVPASAPALPHLTPCISSRKRRRPTHVCRETPVPSWQPKSPAANDVPRPQPG